MHWWCIGDTLVLSFFKRSFVEISMYFAKMRKSVKSVHSCLASVQVVGGQALIFDWLKLKVQLRFKVFDYKSHLKAAFQPFWEKLGMKCKLYKIFQ